MDKCKVLIVNDNPNTLYIWHNILEIATLSKVANFQIEKANRDYPKPQFLFYRYWIDKGFRIMSLVYRRVRYHIRLFSSYKFFRTPSQKDNNENE